MKQSILLVLFLSALSLSATAQNTNREPIPIPHHENVPKDPDSAAEFFVQKLNAALPYYIPEYSLTISQASVIKKTHSVRMVINLDADQTINPEKEFYIPILAAANRPWDLTLLADNGYDLCLQVNTDMTSHSFYYGYGGVMVTLTNEDIQNAVGKEVDMDKISLDYLTRYANNITPRLPIAMGPGEQLVQCYFVDTTFTMTLEYADSIWPEISHFLQQNLDNIRISRAHFMLNDTTNAIAISALVSKTNIRYIYRNQSHTDSLDYSLTPRMLDYVASKMMQEQNTPQSPSDYLLALANQYQRSVPLRIDEETQLVHCDYDSTARIMTYVYEIPESVMLQLETNSQHYYDSQYQRLLQYFRLDDPQVSAMVQNVIAAQVTVNYIYRSAHGTKPVVFTFTAEQLSHNLSED